MTEEQATLLIESLERIEPLLGWILGGLITGCALLALLVIYEGMGAIS